MRSWLNSTLRTRLVLLVLLAIIPALGLILYTASEQRRTATAEAEQQTLRLARLVANNQKQVVDGTRQILMILAQLPVVRQGNSAVCDQLLADILKQHSAYANFAVLDAQGNTICSGIPYSGLVNAADRSYFQRAVQNRKFTIGEYQVGRITKKATINFAYPVLDQDERVQTVVVAALDLAQLNQLAAQVKMPGGSVLSVVDNKGILLVRYPNSPDWIGKSLPSNAFKKMKTDGEGVYEVTSLDGVLRIFAFVPLGDDSLNPDEYIKIGIPTSEVLSNANSLLVRNLISLGAVTILAIIAAWIGGDIFFLQQIQSLVQTAKTLGSGQLNARTGLSHISGEVGQLAQAIDEMAAALAAREKAIASLSQNMQTLFELIPIGILITEDMEFKEVKSNPAFAEILGLSSEANVCHTSVDVQPPSYKIVREGKELSAEEYPLRYAATHNTEVKGTEIDIVRSDGSIFNLFGYAAPLRDEQGNPRGAVAAFLNISNVYEELRLRKQAEEQTRQLMSEVQHQANILDAILSASVDHIFIFDRDGRYQYVSQGGADIFGWKPEEMVGKTWQEINFAPQMFTRMCRVDSQRQTVMATGQPIRADIEYNTANGLHSYEYILSPLYSRDQTIAGVITISRDISGRKQAEVEREKLLVREQAAREAAETANRIKDEFLAVLSHELRTPLNPILGWVTLLRSRQLDEEKKAIALETIERNAKLQTQLIGDLLEISRILQGKLTLNISQVDLAVTIASAKETVRLAAEAKSIQIHTEIAPEVQPFLGDPNRLQQVVWNLLANAVKFTPIGGEVKIKLESTNTYAQIQVSDTGKGITPEFLPYVFETFRQADSATTRKFGGLGLGLAIVRHVVEMHGGTVHADSLGENQGATFTVKLPIITTVPQINQNKTLSKKSLNLRGVRVLVIEDEQDTRELLVFIIQQYGAEVTATPSAIEALKVFPQSQPDIIVCDIAMPEMDGYTFIRQVRTWTQEQGGQIPAIALTAYAGESNRKQALAAGFQRHLSKPVDPEELVEAIASLIS
ncbi:response regulator [Fortiea sp. LEGE XX443]|uniref:ATP-binding protein n=1 Tax=Fortiea sp. LEGE XX443 TaxID=1828611 RepID=UPI00188058AE|nr:ATP-binding protein [Fortiea sp. LEGE XX443]MBE9007300.1 response regulator [Fortiea sp. LEGE XX443]